MNSKKKVVKGQKINQSPKGPKFGHIILLYAKVTLLTLAILHWTQAKFIHSIQ